MFMRLAEIMKEKGIDIEPKEELEIFEKKTPVFYPAGKDYHRGGHIRKEMRIFSPSDWGKGLYSFVGVEIDTEKGTIKVEPLFGTLPLAENMFLALLADIDVRRLIRGYQKEKRYPFRVWKTKGISGREDFFITEAEKVGNFCVTETRKLCHISENGRLNEGFGNKKKMTVDDFVEMVVFMGLTKDMSVKALRKKARVKYIVPRLAEELEGFSKGASKIL